MKLKVMALAFKMLKKKRLDGVLMNIYTGKTIAKKVGIKVKGRNANPFSPTFLNALYGWV